MYTAGFAIYIRQTLFAMTHAKTAAFSLPHQHVASLSQALTHPARLAILNLLADRKCRLAGDICAAVPLARTTVSQHLVALRKLGLLRVEVPVDFGLREVLVRNILGQLVRRQPASGATTTVNLTGLAPGLYWLGAQGAASVLGKSVEVR